MQVGKLDILVLTDHSDITISQLGSALAGFHGPRLNRAQKSAILIVVASNVIDGYLNPPNDVVTARCLVLPPGKGSFFFSEINPPGGRFKYPGGRSLPRERYLPRGSTRGIMDKKVVHTSTHTEENT